MREIKFRAWDGREMIDCASDATPETPFWIIMQFTGLLDKKGKEIYEGDIMRCTDTGHEYNAQMIWEEGGFWIFDGNKNPHLPYKDYREVIGNIYENPELINSDKK